MLVQGAVNRVCEQAMLVIAHPTRCPVLVDDDRDHLVGAPGGGGGGCHAVEVVAQSLGQIDAEHAPHLAVLDGDQHQGFLGHESKHRG